MHQSLLLLAIKISVIKKYFLVSVYCTYKNGYNLQSKVLFYLFNFTCIQIIQLFFTHKYSLFYSLYFLFYISFCLFFATKKYSFQWLCLVSPYRYNKHIKKVMNYLHLTGMRFGFIGSLPNIFISFSCIFLGMRFRPDSIEPTICGVTPSKVASSGMVILWWARTWYTRLLCMGFKIKG